MLQIKSFYIHKIVISVKFCNNLLRKLLGTPLNFAISEILLYPCSYKKIFTACHINTVILTGRAILPSYKHKSLYPSSLQQVIKSWGIEITLL